MLMHDQPSVSSALRPLAPIHFGRPFRWARIPHCIQRAWREVRGPSTLGATVGLAHLLDEQDLSSRMSELQYDICGCFRKSIRRWTWKTKHHTELYGTPFRAAFAYMSRLDEGPE